MHILQGVTQIDAFTCATQFNFKFCSIYIYKLTPWLMEPAGSMPHSQGFSNNTYLKPCVTCMNEYDFYIVGLLASRQTPKLEDHSCSAVHDCLFNIFAANLHIWMPTPLSATQGTRHAVVTGTHGWKL